MTTTRAELHEPTRLLLAIQTEQLEILKRLDVAKVPA
jgi:hypothetical protein